MGRKRLSGGRCDYFFGRKDTNSVMKWKFHIHSFKRWIRSLSMWVFIFAAALIVARIILPFAVKALVNHQLNKAHDYTWKNRQYRYEVMARGLSNSSEIQILKRERRCPFSTLFRRRKSISPIQWRELFHGSVVGEIFLHQPAVNFVMGSTPEQTQNGKDERWDQMLQSLFPVQVRTASKLSKGKFIFKTHPQSLP